MRKTIRRSGLAVTCLIAGTALMFYGQVIPALGCFIAFFCLSD